MVYLCLNDPDWTMVFVSDGCRVVTGYDQSDLEQNRVVSYGNLVHPDDRDALWARCQASLDARVPCHNEYRIIDKTGQTRWVWERAAGIYDTEGKLEAIEGFIQDITARRNAEEAERTSAQSMLDKRNAEAASRAKTEFLNRMSHELRTPLNGILGFSQLLQLDENEPLSAAQRDGIQLIQDAGTHLLQLINEMLDLSRIEAGRVELTLAPIRVADAVRECIALVQPMANARNVRIADETGSPPLAVLADALRIKQVLVNLASNAIKYNRPGGSVRIFCTELSGGRVEIGVEDDGIGLTPQQLENLFQPFNRLGLDQAHSEGTGLGMVITKGLVEVMGGEISVRSAPRHGTVVSIRLPRALAPSRTRQSTRPATSLGNADYGERTIVYIEDNVVNATLIMRIIAKRPQITLHIASDGASGIDLVRDTRPDVVLIDLDLPDMSGNEVLKRLQAEPTLAGLPCIALTASVRPEVLEEAKALGFVDFIGKPVDVRGFLARIDGLLERDDADVKDAVSDPVEEHH
jgi:PAS domain S-box-containing protein